MNFARDVFARASDSVSHGSAAHVRTFMSSIVRPLRRSGLQRQVLAVYRDCLVASRKLPAASQAAAVAFIRLEFRNGAATVDKLDIQRIEHLIRQAQKKVTSYTSPGVSAFDFRR